jgi:hypothetical protein
VEGSQIVGGVRRSTRVSQPLGEWWKNHILPKDKGSDHANVALRVFWCNTAQNYPLLNKEPVILF